MQSDLSLPCLHKQGVLENVQFENTCSRFREVSRDALLMGCVKISYIEVFSSDTAH